MLDEKHAFASLAMFNIQYLIKERLDKRAILYPRIKHVLKQGIKSWPSWSIGNGIGWLLIDSPSYHS